MLTIYAFGVFVSVPTRYRRLVEASCYWAADYVAGEHYWASAIEPQLWLQLPGVVVER